MGNMDDDAHTAIVREGRFPHFFFSHVFSPQLLPTHSASFHSAIVHLADLQGSPAEILSDLGRLAPAALEFLQC